MADDNDIFRDMWDDFYDVLDRFEVGISDARKKQLATVAFSTLVQNYELLRAQREGFLLLTPARVVIMAVLFQSGIASYYRAIDALPHSVLEEIKARLKESELK